MLVITTPPAIVPAAALAGKERDTLRLTWEERRWTRKRVTTGAGRAVALALATGSVLKPGDVLAVERKWYLIVEASAEPVIAVRPRDHDEAIRVAFEVGNRHFSLAIDGECLLVPDDTAMELLLNRIGVPWERREAVFDPIAGGGHRHEGAPNASGPHDRGQHGGTGEPPVRPAPSPPTT
jgi:urease accessory protein